MKYCIGKSNRGKTTTRIIFCSVLYLLLSLFLHYIVENFAKLGLANLQKVA